MELPTIVSPAKLLIGRHGQDEFGAAGGHASIFQDPLLSERGVNQALEIGQWALKQTVRRQFEVSTVISSTWARAIGTAAIAAGFLDTRREEHFILDERLMFLGAGKNKEVIEDAIDPMRIRHRLETIVGDDGRNYHQHSAFEDLEEPYAELAERVQYGLFLLEQLQQKYGGCILGFGHGMWLKLAVGIRNGLSWEAALRAPLRIKNGEIFQFTEDRAFPVFTPRS